MMTDDQTRLLDQPNWWRGRPFLPDIPPLDRPASADDVERARAVFHLDGKSKLAGLVLPAVAQLRRRDREKPVPVLVVQAEVRADGKAVYGIVGGGDIRAASAEELANIKPIRLETTTP